MPQTAVADRMTVGILGQLADLQSMADASVDTATSEEVTASIGFGIFVKHGVGVDSALLPSDPADRLKGISIQTHEYARDIELDEDLKLRPGSTFGVLTHGRVTVAPTTPAAPGDEVHVQFDPEVGHPAGAVRATGSAAKTFDITAFAQWRTVATSAGDLCVLEIDMLNLALAVVD